MYVGFDAVLRFLYSAHLIIVGWKESGVSIRIWAKGTMSKGVPDKTLKGSGAQWRI